MTSTLVRFRRAAFNSQGGHCYYCGSPMRLGQPNEFATQHHLSLKQANRYQCTAEHVRARQDGGGDSRDNIVAACLHCNGTRHKISTPPDAKSYREHVKKRLDAGRWHPRKL